MFCFYYYRWHGTELLKLLLVTKLITLLLFLIKASFGGQTTLRCAAWLATCLVPTGSVPSNLAAQKDQPDKNTCLGFELPNARSRVDIIPSPSHGALL